MGKVEHIKVRVPGERLWAIKKSANTAVLDNMPITPGYSYKDLVEFDPDTFDVTKVLKSEYRPAIVQYPVPEKATDVERAREIEKAYKKVYAALEAKGIMCEGAVAGIMSVAVPLKMTDAEATEIVKAAGATILFPDKQVDNG